jgi:hypothetical protein
MIIYTASHKCYADSVINHIDPLGHFFQYRLYRHNCVKMTSPEGQTIYIKDLRIIKNVPLENMVIIDNSVLSFAFHLENGIPILPYYSNKDDTEMDTLSKYLGKLAKFDNITVNNGATFNLNFLMEEAVKEANKSDDDEDTAIESEVISAKQSTSTVNTTNNNTSNKKINKESKESKTTTDKKAKVSKVLTDKDKEKNELIRTKRVDNLEEPKTRQPTRRKSKIQNLIYENMEKVKK